MGSTDYLNYMEFNYDVKTAATSEIYRQNQEDIGQAIKYKEEAQKLQQEKIEEYLSEDKTEEELAKEYLVDGAILECSSATLETKIIGTRECRPINGLTITKLLVGEKKREATANGLGYGNINDTIVNDNIKPFRCNCVNLPDRQSEIDAIEADASCETEGNCKHLIKLNSKWYNLPSDSGAEYQSFGDKEGEKQTGINMTSCLFCKHGGFITPKRSGQIILIDNEELKVPDKNASTEEVKEYIKKFFLNQGLSEACVAGILGNAWAESEFKPLPAGNKNNWGLFQLGVDDRKINEQQWAEKHGFSNYESIDAQCAFVLYELQTTDTVRVLLANDAAGQENDLICSYERFCNAKNPEEAALIFAVTYEVCYTKLDEGRFVDIQHRSKRVDAAKAYYDEIIKE